MRAVAQHRAHQECSHDCLSSRCRVCGPGAIHGLGMRLQVRRCCLCRCQRLLKQRSLAPQHIALGVGSHFRSARVCRADESCQGATHGLPQPMYPISIRSVHVVTTAHTGNQPGVPLCITET